MVNQLQEKSNLLIENIYEQDYFMWIETTLQVLRSGNLSELDILNLVEEIEDMGKNEKRAVYSNLKILLMHLLKYKYQKEKQSNSWKYTIVEHRQRLKKSFQESPSLKNYCIQIFEECYQDARELAAIETEMNVVDFPKECPLHIEQTLNAQYFPD